MKVAIFTRILLAAILGSISTKSNINPLIIRIWMIRFATVRLEKTTSEEKM